MGTGTVRKFVAEKAFGFIGPDDGSPDVFAPARTLDGDKNNVREGMKVIYEPKPDDRTGKPMASTWKVLDDGLGAFGAMGGMPAAYGAAPAGYAAYGAMPAYGAYGAAPVVANA